MKLKIIIPIQIFLYSLSFGQTYNPSIEGIMNQTNLDSLVSYIRILSGEDSVVINDSLVIVTPRGGFFDNYLAADYIKNQLESFGLNTYDQHFNKNSVKGRNVYAIQTGRPYPDKYFIYCAHWDAVTDYCADDNASGVAGVLEAARILSNYQFEYSIIYAFWDYEELGTHGSWYFARGWNSNLKDIEGVLNFEMSGWDSDDDGLMDIHTKDIGISVSLANVMLNTASLYKLPLKPVVYNPGSGGSDHGSFWYHDYSAICFSEAYWGDDFNPYSESNEDRIDKFNLEYYHNICKLGVATLSTLAIEYVISSIYSDISTHYEFCLYNYPNPFNPSTTITYTLPECRQEIPTSSVISNSQRGERSLNQNSSEIPNDTSTSSVSVRDDKHLVTLSGAEESSVTLKVYDILGREVATLVNEKQKPGIYEVTWNAVEQTSGVYFYKISTEEFIDTKKMILLK